MANQNKVSKCHGAKLSRKEFAALIDYCSKCGRPCEVVPAEENTEPDCDDLEGGMTGCGQEYELSQ